MQRYQPLLGLCVIWLKKMRHWLGTKWLGSAPAAVLPWANAGLGAVHGLAGVIGGKTKAPHGEICGALLPAVLRSHFRKAEPCSEVAQRLHLDFAAY